MNKYYQKIEINLCDLDFYWIARNKYAAITEATKRVKKLIKEIYQEHSDLIKIISIENFKLDKVCENLEKMDSFEALKYLRDDYDSFKIYDFLFTLDTSEVFNSDKVSEDYKKLRMPDYKEEVIYKRLHDVKVGDYVTAKEDYFLEFINVENVNTKTGVESKTGLENKPHICCFDPHLEYEMGMGMRAGANKHGWNNHRNLTSDSAQQILDSLKRHLNAFLRGEEKDEETNTSHLACVGNNLNFLYRMTKQDGYKKVLENIYGEKK